MASKKKAEPNAPADVVASYNRMVASCPEAELKGATMPNTALGGHMYSFIHPSGAVALRLPAADREAFIAEHGSKLYDAYGIIQKEYVEVPHALLHDTEAIAPYFAKSHEYTKSLKPKKSAR